MRYVLLGVRVASIIVGGILAHHFPQYNGIINQIVPILQSMEA